ncbi:hypothetical protein [Streptomyces sp. NPDC057557]|uniref:hypothetical protein n=1 Tax=Streptomyces sp. NPDC057557 TaxID=3346167 RepID=UPI0036B76BE7
MLDPTAFTCRVLAQQLADEWVEYVEATSRRVGTATGYRQAVTLLCRFVDDTLQGGPSAASLAEADPDISDVLLAWEHSLPSQRPVGSTRPGTLASLVRTLISRRLQHPDRPVDDRLGRVAADQHGLYWGTNQELDEYSHKDETTLIRALASVLHEPSLDVDGQRSAAADRRGLFACRVLVRFWGRRSPYAARHRFARSLSVPADGKRKWQGDLSPCRSQLIAHWGACGKTRVVAQNRRPRPQPAEMGARRACVVDVWGTW